MATVAKICHICAVDVSQKKRTKDANGRYYCEACYKAQHARAKSAHASSGGAVATAAPPKKAIPLEDEDGPIGLADEVKKDVAPVNEQAMFACADCKKIVPEKQIRNDDGEFICLPCFARRRQKNPAAPAAGKKSSFKETAADEDENQETWKDTLFGGLVISGGVLVIAFFTFLLLNMNIAPPGKGATTPGLGFAAILATLQTIFVVLKGGALIFSMVLAAQLLGGIDFGYIGSALWKSLALVLGFSVLDFFSSRFETLGMLAYALNGIVLLVAFVAVFRIDFFEAMILSAVNFMIFMGLAIGLAGMAMSLNRSYHGLEDIDEDSERPAMVVPAGGQGNVPDADDE